MNIRQIALLALAVTAAPARASGDGPKFPLGVWYEGGVGAFRDNLIPNDPAAASVIYLKHFKDMAAHGINCAVVPNTPPEHHAVMLDAAKTARVSLIIEINKEGGDLGTMIRGGMPVTEAAVNAALTRDLRPVIDHPALWRVQLLDEPPAGTFPRYAEVAKYLKAYKRKVKPFTCLIGSADFDAFFKATGTDVAAFDHYPIGLNTPLGDIAPMRAFEKTATKAGIAAARHEADAWAVIQVHSITGIHRFPTPGEIRCMSHLSLASGARGLFWFLYQTEYWNKAKGEVMSGFIDTNDKGDARWEDITRLTREINTLVPTLMKLRPMDTPPLEQPKATTHILKDDKGRTYLYTVNLDTVSAQTIENSWAKSAKVTVTRVPSGKRARISVNGSNIRWSERIPAGGGALYRID